MEIYITFIQNIKNGLKKYSSILNTLGRSLKIVLNVLNVKFASKFSGEHNDMWRKENRPSCPYYHGLQGMLVKIYSLRFEDL
jgi:hypothetical protein